jgi:filamentous hemagglutinin family protein
MALLSGGPWVGAQVVLDGSLGAAGPLAGPHFGIDAAVGSVRGNNLFHSFSQFDLQTGDSATFSGPANIQNILGRVTGGAPSQIDGAIRSGIAGANLFLINPGGILFGPHASVDVSGSFAASSAHYLKLADGAHFVAALDADDSVLTTGPVVAFGFLEGASGSVEVRGQWVAGQGGNLEAVGSLVSVSEGTRLEAAGGGIHLVGGAVGEVPVAPVSGIGAGGFAVPVGNGAASVAAPMESRIVIRGGRLVVENAQVQNLASGGDIDLALTDSVQVLRGGQIVTLAMDASEGGGIRVETPSLLIDGQDGEAPTRLAAETLSENPQVTGGDIFVRSDFVELRGGAEISVSSYGAAGAGRVEIEAGTLRLSGSDFPMFPTQIAANAAPVMGGEAGSGGSIVLRAEAIEIHNGAAIMAATMGDADAGKVEIDAGTLTLQNGAITTFSAGAGAGGEIQIRSDAVLLEGPFSSISALTTGLDGQRPAGAGGTVEITAGRLELRQDAAISANTFGDGAGGHIRITADAVVLDGASGDEWASPGIRASSQPPFFEEGGGGRGGDIEVIAGSLSLRGGMPISASTATEGDGGSIRIRAGTVSLEGVSSIQSASTGAGQAGRVQVEATGDITVRGGSFISTSALASSGGDVSVQAGGEVRIEDGRVTAQAGPGGGGNLLVTAPDLVYLLDGTLTAEAVGDGGNLSVDTAFFIVNRGSLVSRSSTANGGNITLRSDYFLRSDTVIDASAPFGLPGTVSVSAPDVDLAAGLLALPDSLLGLETLLRPDCGVRLGGDISSFILLGRGGLPVEPGGFLPSGTVAYPDEKP